MKKNMSNPSKDNTGRSNFIELKSQKLLQMKFQKVSFLSNPVQHSEYRMVCPFWQCASLRLERVLAQPCISQHCCVEIWTEH